MHININPWITRWGILNPFYLLTGQRVHQYKRKFEEMQWLSCGDLRRMQWSRVKEMLSFAYSEVPFYRKLFDDAGIIPRNISDEEDFLHLPLLTKETLGEGFAEIKISKLGLRNFSRTTSGSTGTSLRLVKDSVCLAAMDAVMHRNYSWYGIRMGDKEARFWGKPLSGYRKLKQSTMDMLMNRIRFSAFDISEKACDEFAIKLRKFRPSYVYGYSQTIFRFSEQIIRSNVDLSDLGLNAVIVTGEMISSQQTETIEKAFKTRVSNEYGCTEVGVIAMECPSGNMHLMSENLYVEIVKDGRLAQPGEEGEIIVTELYGNLMPLIRYKVGDVGVLGDQFCDCGRGFPILSRLKGRNDEFIICPDRKLVDPVVFEYILKEMPSKLGRITEFRIIQLNISTLSIDVCYEGTRRSEMLDLVEKKLKELIGKSFNISFNITSKILPEPSGKLRCFISRIGEER